jgi:small subunit ribosomal protein S1
MSLTSSQSTSPAPGDSQPHGSFDAMGTYIPVQITDDDLGGMSLEEAIDRTIVEFDDGDIVKGTVVKVDKDEVLLDIGFKSEGVIPARELSIRHDLDPHEVVELGEEIEALVLQKEDKEGRLILSKKRAQYERAWGTIEQIKESNGVVKGPVIEVVKGGLILDIGLRGFLPASLVELRRVRDLQPYIGRALEAKIIELDKNRNNVVLSRRAWLEETQREQRGEFLVNLKPGEIRKGTVSSVVNFGAFVDLGGMDGLVHVSELSWKHVDHPSSVVQVGDEVTVQVLDVDLDKERISLSLKATQVDPWQEFATNHRVGELVYGRITKLVPFGAFVQVGDGIEGLVHISEMAAHHVDLPEQVVTPGEELWVKIIDIDLQRRRISLSIKQAAEGGVVAEEYQEAFGEHAYDEQGNYIGYDYTAADFTPESESQAAWAEYVAAAAAAASAEGTGETEATSPAAAGDAAALAEEPTAESAGPAETAGPAEPADATAPAESAGPAEPAESAGAAEPVGDEAVAESAPDAAAADASDSPPNESSETE